MSSTNQFITDLTSSTRRFVRLAKKLLKNFQLGVTVCSFSRYASECFDHLPSRKNFSCSLQFLWEVTDQEFFPLFFFPLNVLDGIDKRGLLDTGLWVLLKNCIEWDMELRGLQM